MDELFCPKDLLHVVVMNLCESFVVESMDVGMQSISELRKGELFKVWALAKVINDRRRQHVDEQASQVHVRQIPSVK